MKNIIQLCIILLSIFMPIYSYADVNITIGSPDTTEQVPPGFEQDSHGPHG